MRGPTLTRRSALGALAGTAAAAAIGGPALAGTVIRPAAPASIDDPAPAAEAERGVSLASIPTEATPVDALRALAAAAAVLGEPPPGPDAGDGDRVYGAYARALWDQTQPHRTRSYARALGALRDRAPRELRGLVDELDGAAVALLRDGQEFAARIGAFLVIGGGRPRPGDRQQADWLEDNYASAQGLAAPDSTVRAYRRCLADFTAWCDRYELASSTDPRAVALYLTHLRWKRDSSAVPVKRGSPRLGRWPPRANATRP